MSAQPKPNTAPRSSAGEKSIAQLSEDILERLGVPAADVSDGTLAVRSPIDGSKIASVREQTPAEGKATVARADEAFRAWRQVPAPRRGELVRLLGEELRSSKAELGRLITIETGKIETEGLGEVQEMIDICDFAVGLSRQLYGLTIASERPGHTMRETWHPLGVVGIITAFNFPCAVWSWNAAIALVCGNSVIWKPSEKTPLTALATTAIFKRACARFGEVPAGLAELLIGGHDVAGVLVEDPKVALVSATGSTRMGREIAPRIALRFGRSLLELGGNNAMIVTPTADADLAVRAILFGAVGTAGQRCTTLRRMFVHNEVYDKVVPRVKAAYASVQIGNPLEASTLVGPLIDRPAFEGMQKSLACAAREGGAVSGGDRALTDEFPNAYYVRPALVEMPAQTGTVRTETFAPILYVMRYGELDEAIDLNNAASHGLSSSIVTNDLREAEHFLSASGSDCGIVNVNMGPSGAEIGGAFGGEKETGGGRESGSDSWKAYMRRSTSTVNYSGVLPLAQGVKFDIDA
jgi:aldehyde dehydrogenase (NAD+)